MTLKHPSIETLTDFRGNALDKAQAGAVRVHLENCPKCQKQLGEIKSNAEFLAEIKPDLSEIFGQIPPAIDKAVLRKLTTKLFSSAPKSMRGRFLANQKKPHPDAPAIPDYILLERMGEGSFGAVWHAEDLAGHPCAIKVLQKNQENKAAEYELNGIRQAMRLRHPNLIEIKHIGQLPAVWYYVMELVDCTLDQRLKQNKFFIPEHALEIVARLLDVLEYCHSHNIAHRDIKPANIGFLADGTLKLLDLGLVTPTGRFDRTLLGTPDYMPFKPAKSPDLDDIYATGVILYVMIHGQLPTDPPSMPDSILATPLFDRLRAAALKACDPVPANRFLSAKDFRLFLTTPEIKKTKTNFRFSERFQKDGRK